MKRIALFCSALVLLAGPAFGQEGKTIVLSARQVAEISAFTVRTAETADLLNADLDKVEASCRHFQSIAGNSFQMMSMVSLTAASGSQVLMMDSLANTMKVMSTARRCRRLTSSVVASTRTSEIDPPY